MAILSTKIRPVNAVSPFAVNELFFSVTDERGIIRFGNDVFCRVASYALGQMLGRPHNIIRHPDMPRSPFFLLWDYLGKGKTVVAYVKNMASDGRYYWVLATVMPCSHGYLSIRLKPSSPIQPIVEQVYQQALAREQELVEAGSSPDDAMMEGLALIVRAIQGLGFADYDQFMWHALITEIASREAACGEHYGRSAAARPAEVRNVLTSEFCRADDNRLLSVFRECSEFSRHLGVLAADSGSFATLHHELLPKAAFISELGETINLQALNAQIRSARLGGAGRALEKISEHLAISAGGAIESARELDNALRSLKGQMEELLFQISLSKLQVEMASLFVAEVLRGVPEAGMPHRRTSQTITPADCIGLLVESFISSADRIEPAIGSLEARLQAVDQRVYALQKLLRVLAYIQLSGKVESSRSDDMDAFRDLFLAIDERVGQSGTVLKELHELIRSTDSQMTALSDLDFRGLDRLNLLLQQSPADLSAPAVV